MVQRTLLILFSVLISAEANAQICGELFRSTPSLDHVLHRPFVDIFGRNATGLYVHGPSETRLIRAVQADVLGLEGYSDRARYSLKRAFSLLNLNRARTDDLLVELHRRRYEKAAEKQLKIPTYKDLFSRMRANKVYLSTAFSVAANGAVNFLSYHFFYAFGFLVHIPDVRIFNPRTLPDEVLNELIETSPSEEAPKTRAYVASKVRYGVDTVLATGRRMFNYGVLAVILVTHGDILSDSPGAANRMIDAATSQVHLAVAEQNRLTLQLLHRKRMQFLEAGENEKVAQADRLILEIEQTITDENAPITK